MLSFQKSRRLSNLDKFDTHIKVLNYFKIDGGIFFLNILPFTSWQAFAYHINRFVRRLPIVRSFKEKRYRGNRKLPFTWHSAPKCSTHCILFLTICSAYCRLMCFWQSVLANLSQLEMAISTTLFQSSVVSLAKTFNPKSRIWIHRGGAPGGGRGGVFLVLCTPGWSLNGILNWPYSIQM